MCTFGLATNNQFWSFFFSAIKGTFSISIILDLTLKGTQIGRASGRGKGVDLGGRRTIKKKNNKQKKKKKKKTKKTTQKQTATTSL